MAEAEDVPADVGAGTGDQAWRNGVPVGGHVRQNCCHISDVGQHDRVGDEAGVFELLLLLDRIATLDHRTAERNPIEEVVVGLYFGGFGADDASDSGVGDVAARVAPIAKGRERSSWIAKKMLVIVQIFMWGFLAGLAVLGYQVYQWAKFGVWTALTVGMTFKYFGVDAPSVSWVGIQEAINWWLDSSLALNLILVSIWIPFSLVIVLEMSVWKKPRLR